MTGASPLFACHGVTARHGRIQVVFDVDLQLEAGEVLAVLGPNGAGKSSLFGAIAGTVDGGGLQLLAGASLSGTAAHRRAKAGLGFVPEMRRNIFPGLTVRENLEIGLRLSAPDRREEVLHFILGLFPILGQRLAASGGMLSGGEQQMLAIALALGREPRILLLDEPTQGLAPAVFDVLQTAFSTLRSRGLAILLAEQNLAFAARVSDRFSVLSHGKVVAAGTREELAQPDRIAAAYFAAEQA